MEDLLAGAGGEGEGEGLFIAVDLFWIALEKNGAMWEGRGTERK